jgi:myo-inositol 2-dehydrogenase/D-chiro-inositol 1-dehydrogenase
MIDVALFGAGRIGKIHAGNLAREVGARLKYVVDPNAEAAGELAARHGAVAATTAQVFGDGAIGAVLICSYTERTPT